MCQWLVLVYGVQRHIQQYFSYIMDVSRIGGVKWCIQRKPPTCHRQTLSHVASWTSVVLVELSGVSRENHRPVTDKLYHMLYRIHLTMSDCVEKLRATPNKLLLSKSCCSHQHKINATMTYNNIQ